MTCSGPVIAGEFQKGAEGERIDVYGIARENDYGGE